MTPGNEDLFSQDEKRSVLEDDRRVLAQRKQSEASSYLDQYHSDVGGRFKVEERETITGRVSPKPPPLPSTSPWSGSQPEPGIEPPTGYCIDEMPSENPAGVSISPAPVATDDPAPAPSGDQAPSGDHDVERTGSSLSSDAKDGNDAA